ncbi:putative reverse transcriptase domain-containing protein [Tanacetum coccineum]
MTTKETTHGKQNKRQEVVKAFTPGIDRSYVATTFSPLINTAPTALDVKYTIELVDENFDVIIGMDWLSKYHAMIVCDEKLVRLPYGNETLTIQGDRSESRLNIISCIKTKKYIQKGCHVFLEHMKEKKYEEKSEEKRLKDVPVIRDFSEVFPKDFLGFPPTRQVEF